MATILITGANRGIGLEVARQLNARGDEVIAVCRTPTDALRNLGVRIVDGVDVRDPGSLEKLVREAGPKSLDILLNNAGIMENETFGEIDYVSMERQFEVNALGPLRVTEALAGSLKDGGKIGIVTSRMGSIGDNGSGGHYGYRASKAAVNIIGVSLAHEFKDRGIAVALLHPGMVATELTGGNGVPPEKAASGLIARLDDLTMETTGRFWHAEGDELPW